MERKERNVRKMSEGWREGEKGGTVFAPSGRAGPDQGKQQGLIHFRTLYLLLLLMI